MNVITHSGVYDTHCALSLLNLPVRFRNTPPIHTAEPINVRTTVLVTSGVGKNDMTADAAAQ